MSRKFQCKAIPSTWLENNGRRLDCGPYMSGAIEARGNLLHEGSQTRRIDFVRTSGHKGGMI